MPNRHQRRRPTALALVAGALLLATSCDDEPSGPRQGYTIRVQSGDDQFAGFDQELEEPLRVIVENAATGDPVPGVSVDWSIVEGNGAGLSAEASATGADGVASTRLTLGPADTEYRVRARVEDLVGNAASFDATAVSPARLDSVSPASADAGDTVSIHGSGFAPAADDNTVLIAGFRAPVLEATSTRLRVVVPACAPTRSAQVRVNRGIVESNVKLLGVTGSDETALSLAVGQAVHLVDAAAACVRLAPIAGARYLVVLQNATAQPGRELPWRLAGAEVGLLTAPEPARSARAEPIDEPRADEWPASPQDRLDLRLRELELDAALRGRSRAPAPSPASASAPRVEVGDRRDFWVFRRAGDYARITAVVRHVSDHAILYEDLDAPDDGFEPADFQQFGAIFDDPIYARMVQVFGAPSDVDGNDRIIILFTPVVNRMTPPSSGSAFVAGFFFGIDLLDDQEHGNDAEVFYTLVPDPDGEFGNVRTFEQLLRGVPPVMAHEFQHMIHFNQRVLLRDGPLEQTWLSEGLAHSAEELIGDEWLERGNAQRAFEFRVQNYLRADAFLNNPHEVSPIGPAASLPVRGAAWLLIEYLQGHFGNDAFLRELTQTTTTGVANLVAATGLSWGTILHRLALAIWADDAGVPGLDPVYSYPDVNLREVYASSGFPLQPLPMPWSDFERTGGLPSAGSRFWLLDTAAGQGQLNFGVAGRHSPHGSADEPQLSILRLQ